MSRRQAGSEAKAKSIAEKAKMRVADVWTEELDADTAECEAINDVEGETVPEAAEKNADEITEDATDPLAELYGDTEIRVELLADKWDMYVFLMHHSYMSLTGLIGILLSLFCIGKAISELIGGETSTTTAVFLVIGLWFLVIGPVTMIGKAAMQIKTNPTLQRPVTYVFTEKGLIQEQGEVKVGCRWDQVTKTVMMKRVWILYTGKMRGSILPVRQFGERGEELKTLIRQQAAKKR